MKQPFRIRHLALVAAFTAVAAVAQDPAYVVEDARFGDASITVEHKRNASDERIQSDVMTRLKGMQYIEGKIGVETHDSTVRLTGLVTTSGQAFRAGREARNAAGVLRVENDIRSRVGSQF